MRRAIPLLLVTPLLLSILSGCIGNARSDEDVDAEPTGGLEASQEVAPPAKADQATGAVEGRVLNENAAPIQKAFIILVGSRNSTTSDERGHFSLSYVGRAST